MCKIYKKTYTRVTLYFSASTNREVHAKDAQNVQIGQNA